jgi:putative aldouronate transport system substrate-binding protein
MKSALKIAALSMTMMISLSAVLAGCGANNSDDTAKPADNKTSTTTQQADSGKKADLPPYKITMFVPGSAAQKDQDLVNQEISKYLKDKINASFELTVLDWGSWQNKMNLKFASNEPFDLFTTMNWDNWGTKVQQGVVMDITDLIDKYAPDAKKVIDPALLEGSKVNGKNYSLPVNKELASHRGVLVRKDLVDKYHFDLSKVKKLEDLEPMFDVIKKNEPGVTPFYINKDISPNSILDAQNFDGLGDGVGKLDRDAKDFKVINELESQKTKAAVELARRWYQAGYINKDAATLKDLDGGLKAGKAFSYPDQLKPGKDAEKSTQLGSQWVQVDLTTPIVTTGDTTGAMVSVSRTAKDPARDLMFLNLLYTDKYLVNLIAFGIEGKHYVKKSDNVIDFPQGMDPKTSGYNLNQPWLYGNQFLDYLWANENPQKWENFKKYNQSAERSRVLGFTFNPDPVKNEVAATNNVAKELNSGLYSGTLDPNEYLPKLIEKMKAAGADKIIAEKQKQLDEWVKANKK